MSSSSAVTPPSRRIITSSIRNLILNLDFSVATFAKSIRRHLRYHPINEFEFEFFFESIGIDLGEVNEYLPEKKFFFSEDPRVLEAACTLSGFGFPWNRLGRLYREERSVFFLRSGDEVGSVLVRLSGLGFSNVAVAGICLAFLSVLCRGVEIGCLFVKLKRLFDKDVAEENVESWYAIGRKVRVFYDLGCESEEMWELMGRNRSLFMECSEEALVNKADYFCRFGVGKEEAALLILRNPEVMSFDVEKDVISVKGMLKHFGLSQDEVDNVALIAEDMIVVCDYPQQCKHTVISFFTESSFPCLYINVIILSNANISASYKFVRRHESVL